ncbi:MAG: TIGR00297 family protein [Microcystaceae cyanobacterium]
MEFSSLLLSPSWLGAVGLNTVLLAIALVVPKKLLTLWGYLNAWVLGVIIWGCLGWAGYTVVMAYFLIGSGVTRIGFAEKEAAGIAEKRSGQRGPENVWGSALIATLCALLSLVFPSWTPLLILGYVASFSTKLSDTIASEIGKAYGKSTFLITSFQPVPRGTEGAVSLEGTIAGVFGSLIIALLAWGLGLINLAGVAECGIAAFVATNLESVIGATLQHRFVWLTNELVNVINTAIGASGAIALAFFLSGI